MEEALKVFISYSWDNEEHKKWVLDLADKLTHNGIYVFLDQYDLKVGKPMTHFMEKSVSDSDKVLMIMTPNYKNKADGRIGGVGFEYSMITHELYQMQDNEKFLPIRRMGSYDESAPVFLSNLLSHDMTNERTFSDDFSELLRIIYNESKIKRPALGNKPAFISVTDNSFTLVKKFDEQVESDSVNYFIGAVRRKPIFAKYFEFEKSKYIIGFYEKNSQYHGKMQHLCILTLFANNWQIFIDQQLDEFECYPDLSNHLSIIMYHNNIYFYYERVIQEIGTAFNGIGKAEFSLFDFKRGIVKLLIYEGTRKGEQIEGSFNMDSILGDEDFEIYKHILEEGAAKSGFIYRTSADYNLEDPSNLIEKWDVENPDFYNNEFGKVIFHYYDEMILGNWEEYGNMELYRANTNHIENSDFVLFWNDFMSPIFSIRKSDSKQFVVLVPQGYGAGGTWGLRSIKIVEFLEENIILAKNEYESYKIDLITGEYEREYFGAK